MAILERATQLEEDNRMLKERLASLARILQSLQEAVDQVAVAQPQIEEHSYVRSMLPS